MGDRFAVESGGCRGASGGEFADCRDCDLSHVAMLRQDAGSRCPEHARSAAVAVRDAFLPGRRNTYSQNVRLRRLQPSFLVENWKNGITATHYTA